MWRDRFRRRLRSVRPLQATLACTLSLLVITSGCLAFVSTAQEVPDGVDDGATFTIKTGSIWPSLTDGGQICAEKIESDVNKVTITDSTLKDVNIYLGDDGEVKTKMSFPKGTVDGKLVIYTNGENALINTLASLGLCLPPGLPNPLPTTIEAYWLGADHMETTNLKVSSGGSAPEASGPTLDQFLNKTNTSRNQLKPVNPNNTTATNNTTTTPTNNTTVTPTNNTTTTINNTTITPTNNTTATPVNNTTTTQTQTNNSTQTATATTTNNTTTTASQQNNDSTPDQSTSTTISVGTRPVTTVAGSPTTAESTTTTTESEDDGFLGGLFG